MEIRNYADSSARICIRKIAFGSEFPVPQPELARGRRSRRETHARRKICTMLAHADSNREVARMRSLAQELMICVVDGCNEHSNNYTRFCGSYINDTELEARIVLDGEYHFRVQKIEVFAISD
jgi:hypothetical protein